MENDCELVVAVIAALEEDAIRLQQTATYLRAKSFKSIFLNEAPLRSQFAQELRNSLAPTQILLCAEAPSVEGIASSIVDQDRDLLIAAEAGEETLKTFYKRAISDTRSVPSVLEILVTQNLHIVESHIRFRDLVESLSWIA